MPSQQVLQAKQELVAGLTEKLNAAKAGVIVDYSGITVADDTALRRSLREAGVEYSVVKNTLLGRAADNAGLGDLKEVLQGTTAIAISTEDELAPAKVLCEYAEKHDNFKVKAGFFEGKAVSAETVKELSKVPPREVLLAMFLGGLNATVAGLARALNAVAEKQGGEAPAEA
ncbi:MAG: 50S ribosomal protein L10 [Clostridia bacterium]|nr:50S ribosomal protein L10 [Clostridia bacterium]